jgi:hypothetical protein
VDVIAEHRIDVLYPDGERDPVLFRVGRPRPHPEGDHACPVSAGGLRIWSGETELRGVGSFHALMIGVRFLYDMLSVEVERGATLHREDGGDALDLTDLFVLYKVR